MRNLIYKYIFLENAINTTIATPSTVSATPSATQTPSSTNIPSTNNSKKLPGWAIAVIVIASLLFLLATAALIWAYRRYRNKKQLNGGAPNNGHNGDDEKVPVLTPNKNESNIVVAASPTAANPIGKTETLSMDILIRYLCYYY